MDTRFRVRPSACTRQCGQALVESLVAMLGLAVLWVAIHWLAHYQDMALSVTHASRHAAFLATREGATVSEGGSGHKAIERFFSGSAHRWTDRRGRGVAAAEISVQRSRQSHPALSVHAQPGGGHPTGHTLRKEWSLEDTGVLRAQVRLHAFSSESISNEDTGLLRLSQFDRPYEVLRRSTSILTDAGHAMSDDAAQSRLSVSRLAWAAAETASRTAAGAVMSHAEGVDSGWGRPGPGFDWLHAWSGRVPDDFIQDYEGD